MPKKTDTLIAVAHQYSSSSAELRAMHARGQFPTMHAATYAELADALDHAARKPPFFCVLCGQRIDDSKPCGCGARKD